VTPYVKGNPVRVFSNHGVNGLSDVAIDCRNFNAVSVAVYLGGAGTGTVSVEGSDERGGNYLPLTDPNASKAVTENVSFDCIVGAAWARIRLAAITGGLWTIIVTPYVSPGQTRLDVSVEAEPSGDGTYTTPTPTPVNVSTASTVVLAANTNRKYVLLVNDSDTPIYVSLGGVAAVNQGIRLNSRGGAYEISRKLGNLYTGAINAIQSDAGTKRLLVVEGV
jgi:hypothetical protein